MLLSHVKKVIPDGTPPHYARTVRQHLHQAFPQRWFGRRGSIEWPSRSPELTPMDFFSGGVVKNKVYERNSHIVKLMEIGIYAVV